MRKVILSNADKDLINTICECVHKCLNGNKELNNEIKTKLKRHKNDLRNLVGRNKPLKIKKKFITKRWSILTSFIINCSRRFIKHFFK
jgi:hypothetical protein